MKRSLVFVSLSAIAMACAAQSSVTISGSLRSAVTHSNDGTTPTEEGIVDGWSLADHSSALIFSGKEDLGGGMHAGFELATFVHTDTGAARTPFWARRSVVTLGGSFGEIYLGRSLTPQQLMALLADPWYWDGSGSQVGWFVQQAHYRSTAFIRTNNTLGYVSPNVAGFTLSLAAAAGENTVSRNLGGSLVYSKGPIWAGIAHDRSHGFFNNPTEDKVTTAVAAYDFGVVRPMASFSSSKVNGVSYKGYSLAMTAPVGSGSLKAQYASLDDIDTAAPDKQKFNKVGLGYEHSLSKRTSVFVQVSHAKAQTYTAKNVVELGLQHGF
jgi:predicted porin